jgi:predicted peptidase
MKTTRLLLIVALAITMQLSAMAQNPDNSAFEKRTFIHKGDTLLYRMLLPVGFDPAKKYPVVLFLHGRGESGNDNERQLIHGASLFLADSNRHRFPAVVIFPQCKEGSYWANLTRIENNNGSLTFQFQPKGKPTRDLDLVMRLMSGLRKEEWFDKKQFYLGGLSMGGMGTFELLSRKPGWFAAAVPICGGAHEARAKSFAKKTPVWIFHGIADDVVPVRFSETMAKAIETAGGAPKLTLYPGVGHNAWDFTFKEPELLPWLFSHRKR